jgi:hypothetical protein
MCVSLCIYISTGEEPPPELAPGYSDLMQRCWAEAAEDRPSFNGIIKELRGMVQVRMDTGYWCGMEVSMCLCDRCSPAKRRLVCCVQAIKPHRERASSAQRTRPGSGTPQA